MLLFILIKFELINSFLWYVIFIKFNGIFGMMEEFLMGMIYVIFM